MKFSIVSRECVEFGIFEGKTAMDAFVAMLKDSGCRVEIVDGEIVCDNPAAPALDDVLIADVSADSFYVIYSDTSENGPAGLRPQVMFQLRSDIVKAADYEFDRSGKCREDLAGIEWLEGDDGCMHPERKLTEDEIFALSIEKLSDDGRIFVTFSTDEAGTSEFLEAAKSYGLEAEAREIVGSPVAP